MPIDLNADVGEGFDDVDAALIPMVTSVNVACGGHAGDPATMARTVALAMELGVAIGAHPGYPDREGFGRRDVPMSAEALRATIGVQLAALADTAREVGAEIRHVKPHGALYNRAARDPALARLVAEAVRGLSPALMLVGLAGSDLLVAGRAAGLAVAAEGFADRAYEPDGSLRPRGRPGAVIADPDLVAAQAVSIALDGRAPLEHGGWLPVVAQTLCLHGDSPNAVVNAQAIRAALEAAGVTVAPLSRPA